MRPTSLAASGKTQIKVLSRQRTANDGAPASPVSQQPNDEGSNSPPTAPSDTCDNDGHVIRLKEEKLAIPFKLIDASEWNIRPREPASESEFFAEGFSAMSIISVLGAMGAGKSSLLNKLAGRDVFPTHNQSQSPGRDPSPPSVLNTRHKTRGIDVLSTYDRILLDCQPMQAPSVMEDFLKGRSASQFQKGSLLATDPLTSCDMISLQLATFLVATSDHVIIVLSNLIDVHLLKLLASAIMLIGEDNLRAKFVIYSLDNQLVHEAKLKRLVDKCLGPNVVRKYVSDEQELYGWVAPFSLKKCDMYSEDPSTFTGKNWLASCQRLWNSTIRNSPMFADYAMQVYKSYNGG